MEFARGGPRLRARKLYAAGNPFAHALAASTAASRAGLPYASSLTRPSLGPMSASSLHSPRERNDANDADETTPTPKPMTPRRPSRSSSRRARASRITRSNWTSPPTRKPATRPSTPTARTTCWPPTQGPVWNSTSELGSVESPRHRADGVDRASKI